MNEREIGKACAEAEKYVNNPGLEQAWAMKAIKYAETHFKLLQCRDAASQRLTRLDDEIHKHFTELFKDLKVDIIEAESIKSMAAKEAWRPFCNAYEGKVHDYNFATLLRLNAQGDYSEDNTIIVPRIQFLALEIARNKAGLNSSHYSNSTL